MIGRKFIPQTIKGDQASRIAKDLSSKADGSQSKGRAPLPDKFSTSWK